MSLAGNGRRHEKNLAGSCFQHRGNISWRCCQVFGGRALRSDRSGHCFLNSIDEDPAWYAVSLWGNPRRTSGPGPALLKRGTLEAPGHRGFRNACRNRQRAVGRLFQRTLAVGIVLQDQHHKISSRKADTAVSRGSCAFIMIFEARPSRQTPRATRLRGWSSAAINAPPGRGPRPQSWPARCRAGECFATGVRYCGRKQILVTCHCRRQTDAGGRHHLAARRGRYAGAELSGKRLSSAAR